LKIIQNLIGKRLDPEVAAALLAVYARGEIRIQRVGIRRQVAVDASATAATTGTSAPATVSDPPELERTRV
jgi:hypothetical protein